jgi:hypothetical protein
MNVKTKELREKQFVRIRIKRHPNSLGEPAGHPPSN